VGLLFRPAILLRADPIPSVLTGLNAPALNMMRKGQTTAHSLGLHILVLETGSDPDYDATFENLVQRRVGPLIVGTAAFFSTGAIDSLSWQRAKQLRPGV
jgi:hypothetical protein